VAVSTEPATGPEGQPWPLVGQVALVTGGTRGIGLAVCEALAAAGSRVAVASRSLHLAEAAVRRLEKTYRVPALAIELDVTKPPSVENMAEKLLKRYSRIDTIVNNAGVMYMEQLLESDIDQFTETMTTNVGGPFLVTRALVEEMMSCRRGCIVNMAAMAGLKGAPFLTTYCASKAALISMTQSWAEELAEFGVPVWAVCPDVVATESVAALLDLSKVRALQPEDVAKVVADLVIRRDAESGAVIPVENEAGTAAVDA
jgi:NAD(P)-dependent dehydrogenase (short-subunit alcohol dehydrogenase family)